LTQGSSCRGPRSAWRRRPSPRSCPRRSASAPVCGEFLVTPLPATEIDLGRAIAIDSSQDRVLAEDLDEFSGHLRSRPGEEGAGGVASDGRLVDGRGAGPSQSSLTDYPENCIVRERGPQEVTFLRALSRPSNLHDDLPLGTACFEIGKCILCLSERKYPVDHRMDMPRLEKRTDLCELAAVGMCEQE
jgi:hypothetical protein